MNFADDVVVNCDVCKASEKAPHAPAVGASTVAMFHEKLQVDLLFLGDVIACALWMSIPRFSS